LCAVRCRRHVVQVGLWEHGKLRVYAPPGDRIAPPADTCKLCRVRIRRRMLWRRRECCGKPAPSPNTRQWRGRRFNLHYDFERVLRPWPTSARHAAPPSTTIGAAHLHHGVSHGLGQCFDGARPQRRHAVAGGLEWVSVAAGVVQPGRRCLPPSRWRHAGRGLAERRGRGIAVRVEKLQLANYIDTRVAAERT